MIRELIIKESKTSDPDTVALQEFLQKKFSSQAKVKKLRHPVPRLFREMPQVTSMAPVRSKPQRTYDPLTEVQTPEGSDVPMYLMRLKRTSDKRGKQLIKALADFGKQSGLFSAVAVNRNFSARTTPDEDAQPVHDWIDGQGGKLRSFRFSGKSMTLPLKWTLHAENLSG